MQVRVPDLGDEALHLPATPSVDGGASSGDAQGRLPEPERYPWLAGDLPAG